MSFVLNFVTELDAKWQEVELLIAKAKEVRSEDEPLYNALCRSVTVLLLAHLEGFVKDLPKYIIKDLNKAVPFKDLSTQIQRTYCKKFIGGTGDSNKPDENRITALVDKFGECDAKITDDPFYYATNKNPNPNVIVNIFSNFGIKNVFACLHESSFDEAFSDSDSTLEARITDFKNIILSGLQSFPYQFDVSGYNLGDKNISGIKPLWSEFVEQVNQRRHDVAHGNNFQNADDISDLKRKKNQAALLQLVLACVLCEEVARTCKVEQGTLDSVVAERLEGVISEKSDESSKAYTEPLD